MKPSNRSMIPFAIVSIPYILLVVYYISSFFNDSMYFLLPTGLMALLPISVLALFLKFAWKIDYEDGTDKGDAKTLFFGTLAFMGIVGGIAAWFYMLVLREA